MKQVGKPQIAQDTQDPSRVAIRLTVDEDLTPGWLHSVREVRDGVWSQTGSRTLEVYAPNREDLIADRLIEATRTLEAANGHYETIGAAVDEQQAQHAEFVAQEAARHAAEAAARQARLDADTAEQVRVQTRHRALEDRFARPE